MTITERVSTRYGKRRRLDDGEDDDLDDEELQESVRKIAALLEAEDGPSGLPEMSIDRSDPRVAKISAEIVAALADARDETDEEMEDEDSGEEMDLPEPVALTSAVRGDGTRLIDGEDDGDDSDTFPIPLRARKGKETFRAGGTKRKRL